MALGKPAKEQLLVTSEGGKLLQLDVASGQYRVLYEHPQGESVFGVTSIGDRVYLSGATFVAAGQLSDGALQRCSLRVPFRIPLRGDLRRGMRWLWSKLGAHARVLSYDKPGLHQLNVYGSSVYIAATSWNEVWELDLDLNLKQRRPVEPHILDYFHLNNVFCDGLHYYVCLNRYAGRPGPGGYAKFDLEWNEVERRAVGWESHAFAVIDHRMFQLCCFSWRSKAVSEHPRKAGLMVEDKVVFEYDPEQYFCKDFSMDDEHVFIVGGSNTPREKRAKAVGIVFILNRKFELLDRCVIEGLGGFNGCRLLGVDHTRGHAPFARALPATHADAA